MQLQKILEGLPWYIKAPAGVCGAILSALADQFPPSLAPFAIIGGTALFLWVGSAFLWHVMNHWRVEQGKTALMLEPWHIIAVGLTIAVGGLMWQWRHVAATDPQLAQLKSQVEDLTKQLATTAPTKPNVPPPSSAHSETGVLIANRYYSVKNKEEVAGLLDRIADVINKEGDETLQLAEIAINRSPWDRPGEDIAPFVKRMDDVANLTVRMHIALYDEIVDKEREYRVEVNSILFPKEPFIQFQIAANEFRNGLSVWMKARDTIDPTQRQNLLALVMSSRMSFGQAREKFVAWLSQRIELINQTRRALRA
jgi:hypothetical protein